MTLQIAMDQMLLQGAQEVFETMIFMDLMKSDEPMNADTEERIMGSISFKGDIEGCMSICCARKCANEISANMLGMDPSEDISEEDLTDAMGEVANLVMGSFKTRMLDHVQNIEVSIPTVVCGQNLHNTAGEGSRKEKVNISIESTYIAELNLMVKDK